MFLCNEFSNLLLERQAVSDHRLFGPPILEKDLGDIRESPAVLQSAEPKIPVFESLNWHRAVVPIVLFPDSAAVQGRRMDEVPAQQSVDIKRAATPPVRSGPEALRIPVRNANLRV